MNCYDPVCQGDFVAIRRDLSNAIHANYLQIHARLKHVKSATVQVQRASKRHKQISVSLVKGRYRSWKKQKWKKKWELRLVVDFKFSYMAAGGSPH